MGGALPPPVPGSVDLYEAHQGGYAHYRIPGLVATPRGTVLVYAEARRTGTSDWDDIDITLRRSPNGGRTFEPPWKIERIAGVERNPVAMECKQGKPEWRTYNNPTAIAGRDGRVHLLFCAEYARVFYMRSDDDARTFSKPVEITSTFEPLRAQYRWRVVATGPGHGIQLKSGRLLVPVWLALGVDANGHAPSVNGTIYSDDNGGTWRMGELAIVNRTDFPDANESTVIERRDGSVVMNVRTGSERNRRVIVTSPDGISRWSEPHYDETLTDPICAAGLLSVPTRQGALWAFSNLDSTTRADGKRQASKDRRNLTLRLSHDEGATWPEAQVLEPGRAGYSDLAALADGTILCYYEAKNASHANVLRLTRVSNKK